MRVISSTSSLAYLTRLRRACEDLERIGQLLDQLASEADRGWIGIDEHGHRSRMQYVDHRLALLIEEAQELAVERRFAHSRDKKPTLVVA